MAAPDSSDQDEIDLRKVVQDSDSEDNQNASEEEEGFEGGEDEMEENAEGGESEMSDEEALLDFNKEFVDKAEKKFVESMENNIPALTLARRAKKDEINVIFEYSQPSEAYYHTIKALLA